jgi:hypothetical protein
MKYLITFFKTCLCWVGIVPVALAQPGADPAAQLENLVRKEGEIYVAVERYEPEKGKNCRVEDVFTNRLLAKGDSLTVPYANHTESFCEAFVLNSQFVYQVRLRDVDPARLVLAQRTYNYGTATLLEGQPAWFEVHLATREGKPRVQRRDVINQQADAASSLRILFQTKEGATKALALLRELVAGAAGNEAK